MPNVSVQPTLVGVTSGTLVGLDTVVTLVETLVAAGDGDSVVASQEPTG